MTVWVVGTITLENEGYIECICSSEAKAKERAWEMYSRDYVQSGINIPMKKNIFFSKNHWRNWVEKWEVDE